MKFFFFHLMPYAERELVRKSTTLMAEEVIPYLRRRDQGALKKVA